MSNFRKFVSMSAVAILGVTNLLTPLSYASAASDYDSLNIGSQGRSFSFLMPNHHVTLYAVTEANHYFVRYNAPDKTSGTMSDSEHVYDQSQNLTKNDYKKTGYTFSGWNTSSSGDGTGYADEALVKNLTAVQSGRVDIYAEWNANKYNINYTLNSGAHGTNHPEEATYNIEFEVSHPSRSGYTFSGWDISGMDSTSHTVGGEPSTATNATEVMGTKFKNLNSTNGGTVTFAARWNAAASIYHVYHELQNINDDFYTLKEEQTLTGLTDDSVRPDTKTYIGFTAPSSQSGTVTADGNLAIIYQYTRNTYNLTLIPDKGIKNVSADGSRNHINSATTQTTQEFKYGESIELSLQEKPGYEGGQWVDGESQFTMPASNQTRTARATPINYTISYDLKGGSVSQTNPGNYTVESGSFTLNNPTRLHSQFAGWTAGSESGTITMQIPTGSIGDRSYTATWTCDTGYILSETSCDASTNTTYTVNHYKADLSGNYNNVFETKTQTGATDDNTNATAQNYDGFEVDGSIEVKKINGDGSTVVNVYYKRKEYTLTITNTPGVIVTAIGEHPTGTNGKYKYGDTVTITASTGAGYDFASWTVTNGNVSNDPSTIFTMPAENVTIKANVTPKQYTITYELHNGSTSNPTSYTVVSDTFTLTNPTRTNSTFVGWRGTDISGTGKTEVTITKGSVGNRSYEAIWRCNTGYHDVNGTSCVANTYNVVVPNLNGLGHGSANDIVFTYDNTGTLPEEPSQSGYNFVGWEITGMSGGVTHYIGTITTTGDSYTYRGTTNEFMNLTVENGGTVTLTALWEARNDTDYVVYHYYKELGKSTYELKETENLTGTTDDELVFSTMKHDQIGFTYSAGYTTGGPTRPTNDGVGSTTIKNDGTTEVYLYYNRNKFNVTLSGDAHVQSLLWEGPREFEYGATVEVSATPMTGYHLKWRES